MKLKEGFVSRKVGTSTVVVSVSSSSDGKMFRLNATAGEIFDMLMKGLSEDGIAAELTKEYGVSFDEARSDVHEAVANMVESGFVTD